MQKQNLLISFLQVFGIVLVVAGHSDYQNTDNPVHAWIYSFHMPLFMFISGFLLCCGILKRGTALAAIRLYGSHGFIYKKICRLLIPYVFISTLAFFPKAMMSKFAARPLDISWNSYFNMLIHPWNNAIIFFWFLPTLFIIFLIVVYSAKLSDKLHFKIPCILLLLGSLLLHLFNPAKGIGLFNISGVVYYLLYFLSGYYCCFYHIEETLQKQPAKVFILTFLLSILYLRIPHFTGLDVLIAINGIGMSICLGHLYIRWGFTFFNHLFGSSYAIYLFSWFPQVAAQQILIKLTGAPWYVTSPLALISGIYIPWLLYRWIIKNRERKAGKIIAYMTGQ